MFPRDAAVGRMGQFFQCAKYLLEHIFNDIETEQHAAVHACQISMVPVHVHMPAHEIKGQMADFLRQFLLHVLPAFLFQKAGCHFHQRIPGLALSGDSHYVIARHQRKILPFKQRKDTASLRGNPGLPFFILLSVSIEYIQSVHSETKSVRSGEAEIYILIFRKHQSRLLPAIHKFLYRRNKVRNPAPFRKIPAAEHGQFKGYSHRSSALSPFSPARAEIP